MSQESLLALLRGLYGMEPDQLHELVRLLFALLGGV